MNWLIREKMFTCFYNKFRPVNCVHYIKCGVISSLLTLFWLLQKVYGTFDHCFIMTHSFHKEGDLQIYFGVIFPKIRHHTQTRITSGTLIWCALSLASRKTQRAAHLVWRYRWPVFVMATLESQNIFCARTWSSNRSGGGTILAVSSFLKFLTRRSLKSRWVYLAPHEDNIIQLLSIANNYNGLPYLFSSVWLAQFQKPDASEIWTSSTVTAK